MNSPRDSLRAVIADDEAGARAHLRQLLAACGVRIVGECSAGAEVMPEVERAAPDLVCLDIRMPDLDGVEVARRLPPHLAVVFTTGYTDFATAAFELGAVHYLLKPLSLAPVAEAMRRVQQRVSGVTAQPSAGLPAVQRLFVPLEDHSVGLAPHTIRYIEARDGMALVHSDTGTYRARVPLARLVRVLEPWGFLRTHRAYLVNLHRVSAMVPWSRHAHSLLLEGGQETHVPVAKSRLAAFRGRVMWISQAGGQRGGPGTAGESRDRDRGEPGAGESHRRRPGR